MMAVDEVDPLEAVRAKLRVVSSVGTTTTSGMDETRNTTAVTGGLIPVSYIQRIFASAVAMEKPDFMWEGWMVKRAFQLLIGRQGAGKTTWASHLIALASTGKPFPDDPVGARDPINVGVMSLEDPDSRVRARLQAAGADLDRVVIMGRVEHEKEGEIVEQQWMMPRDINALERLIVEEKIGLVVIDGIGFCIQSDGEPGYGAVSQALSALGKVAERTNSAIVGLTHPPKGGSDPVTAAIGSTAWTAQSRICWVLGVDKNDETKRVISVSKTNFKEPQTGYEFAIADDPETEAGFVVGVEASDITSAEIMSAFSNEEERGAKTDAKEFLTQALDPPGYERLSSELFKEAAAQGISDSTLTRAKRDLKIKPHKLTGKDGQWVWALPRERDSELGHGVPPDVNKPAPTKSDYLPVDLDFNRQSAVFSLELGHTCQVDQVDQVTVRNDVEPEDLTGAARVAMFRRIGGKPLTREDEAALIAAGVATRVGGQ